MKAIKNKNFPLLLLGQTAANIGDTIYLVAVISAVFSWTNSAFAASIVPVLLTSAKTIGGFLTPALSARFPLEHLLKFTQGVKTIFLILLGIYVQSAIPAPNIFVLYTFVLLIACLDGCSDPITLSLVPKYVHKEFLIKANSLINTMIQLVNIGSWAVGTSLLLWFSVIDLIWIDTGFSLIATLLLYLLPTSTIGKKTQVSFRQEIITGWRYTIKNPFLRTILTIHLVEAIANSVWVSSILLVFVHDFMNKSDNWWGYINATFFIGSLLGTSLVMSRSSWFDKNKWVAMFIGTSLSGIATLVIISGSNPRIILMLSFLIGLFSQIKNVPQNTLIQQQVQADQLIYVYSSLNIVYTAVFACSILLVGKLVDLTGITSAFLLSGSLILLVSLILTIKKPLFIGKIAQSTEKNNQTKRIPE